MKFPVRPWRRWGKILENTSPYQYCLANEMAILCHKMGIDVWEVINAAATKPYGFMPFTRGPGLGGHCIPIDPSSDLVPGNTTHQVNRDCREINNSMPEFVVNRMQILNQEGKPLKGAKVLVPRITKRTLTTAGNPGHRHLEMLKGRGPTGRSWTPMCRNSSSKAK